MSSPARPIIMIGILFFIFGFITWLCAVLIPYLQIACGLNNFQAQLVSFAFYISYFVMALPSGRVLHYTGFRKGISLGLLVMMIGSLFFIPAAVTRMYSIFLLGLFIQGAGLAILQTAANPYVTILGEKESGARRMSIMGICNGVAGIIAPVILGRIVLEDTGGIKDKTALAGKVIIPYLFIALALLVLSAWFYFLQLPEPVEEDQGLGGDTSKRTTIFAFPHLLLGVLTLFLYVGIEVIAGNTIIGYASWQGIPLDTAKFFPSLTLSGMLVGYMVGIICIPKKFSQVQALKFSALLGIGFALAAIFTKGILSVICVALLGLSNSLMWPAIWPLAIADLGRFTKTGSALLVMAIAGGAVIPLLYGAVADRVNPQQAYWVVIPCCIMIEYFAIAGHKIRIKYD